MIHDGIEFRLRAGAQHDRRVIAPALPQRGGESRGHCQQCDQHADDAGNAHDNDGRGTEPLRNRRDRHFAWPTRPACRCESRAATRRAAPAATAASSRARAMSSTSAAISNAQTPIQAKAATQRLFRDAMRFPTAPPTHRRCAAANRDRPASRRRSGRSTASSPSARAHTTGDLTIGGNTAPVVASSPPATLPAINTPATPPSSSSNVDSASNSPNTLPLVNPIVFSIASSGMRSRTACAIVLPVSRISVKNTAAMIAPTIRPISPNWLRNASWNARSLCVLVS